MSAKEMQTESNQTESVKTTTHYWGYRELDAFELRCVGGGDDSDGGDSGDSGDSGGMCDASASSGPSESSTDNGFSNEFGGYATSETVASISRREANNICIADCTPNLPTPAGNYGMNFFSCMTNCLNSYGF